MKNGRPVGSGHFVVAIAYFCELTPEPVTKLVVSVAVFTGLVVFFQPVPG